jgi:hypothetical protein
VCSFRYFFRLANKQHTARKNSSKRCSQSWLGFFSLLSLLGLDLAKVELELFALKN